MITTVGGLSDAAEADIVAAYHGLGVTEEQYYDVAEFFIDVLRHMNAEAQLVAAIGWTLASVHDQALAPGA
jgi:hypothetical protein